MQNANLGLNAPSLVCRVTRQPNPFEDEGLGLSLPGFLDSDEWLALDYEDWGKDDFDNFNKLNFNDQADSMRWFAPDGCTMRVNQHSFNDSDFPGSLSLILPGSGAVKAKSVLDNVDVGDTISSAQFFSDCDAYYNAPITVSWDLNFDSIFETTGENTSFSAAELDGPGVRIILVRSQHPTDPTPLGQSAPQPVRIEVRNVPPIIGSFTLVDFLGSPVPFALLNVEYTAQGGFTDPGKPDRQTAFLDWDDGTVESSAFFDVFTDAFGGVTGEFERRHSLRLLTNIRMRSVGPFACLDE